MSKKGKEKNTKNKAKHSNLMHRKKNKLRETKKLTNQRLKEINKKINAQK